MCMKQLSLTEALADLRPKIGEPYRSSNDRLVRRLIETEVAAQAVKAGDKFPSFALTNAEGKLVRLDDLLAQGPLVLSFYRGLWCPFCSMELEALHRASADIGSAGATLVAVTPESGTLPLDVKRERGFAFEILCDLDNGLALECGLVFRLSDELISVFAKDGTDFPLFYGNDSWFLPIPATYIIRKDGAVHHAYVNPDFRERLDPEEIVKLLQQVK